MLKHTIMFAAVAALLFALAPVAQADLATISVNIEKLNTSTAAMPFTEIAGLVPVGNWNNYDPAAGVFLAVPVDDSGNALGNFSVTGSGDCDSWNTLGSGNKLMFGDMTMGNWDLVITNIPYASYDIIVYSKVYSTNPQNFSIDGGVAQTITNFVAGWPQYEGPIQFEEAAWSNGVLADGVHYTTFAGLSGGSHTLTHGTLNGFQIVEVPEPATMAMLAIGGVGILIRRRRRLRF